MSIEKVLDVLREGFMTILIVAGPTLAIALVVGLIISIIQAATQLQEQTLSFVPKNIGRNRSLIVFGNFMLDPLIAYTEKIFELIAGL